MALHWHLTVTLTQPPSVPQHKEMTGCPITRDWSPRGLLVTVFTVAPFDLASGQSRSKLDTSSGTPPEVRNLEDFLWYPRFFNSNETSSLTPTSDFGGKWFTRLFQKRCQQHHQILMNVQYTDLFMLSSCFHPGLSLMQNTADHTVSHKSGFFSVSAVVNSSRYHVYYQRFGLGEARNSPLKM